MKKPIGWALFGKRGSWFNFRCSQCGWKGTRYRNAKKCLKCHSALLRLAKCGG